MSTDEMKAVTITTSGGKVLGFGIEVNNLRQLRKHLNDPSRKYQLFNLNNYLEEKDRTDTQFNLRPANIDTFVIDNIERLKAQRSQILVPQAQVQPRTIKLKGP
jgi:hypothetical protein